MCVHVISKTRECDAKREGGKTIQRNWKDDVGYSFFFPPTLIAHILMGLIGFCLMAYTNICLKISSPARESVFLFIKDDCCVFFFKINSVLPFTILLYVKISYCIVSFPLFKC